VRLNYVVTEWVENETVAFRMTSGQFLKSDAQRWAIATEEGASRFTFSEEAEMPYGLLGRLLGLVASVSSSANVCKMLEKSKELAEVA